VYSNSGKPLFSITQKAGIVLKQNNIYSVLIRIIAAILVLAFIYVRSRSLALANRRTQSILLFLFLVAGLRVLSYYFPIPLNFRQFELFDPTVYSSNPVLRSLGDLLINTMLFVFIVYFILKHLPPVINTGRKRIAIYKWIWLELIAITLLTLTFYFGYVIRTLISDSQISFDVINFFTLDIFSVIGFIGLTCLAVGYFFITLLCLNFVRSMPGNNTIPLLATTAVTGLFFLTFRLAQAESNFELFLLIWLCFYLLLAYSRVLSIQISRVSSTRLIFWLFFFSVSITAIIINENTIKEYSNRKSYAETLSSKTDPSSEILMNTLLTDFRMEVLAPNFYRFKEEASGQKLKDSLTGGNFSSLTNKYDTRIYCYGPDEKALFNDDSVAYNTLNAIYTAQAKPTGIPDLYYYDETFDKFSYICKKTVLDTSKKTLGYLFILASPKSTRADALYPELFSRGEHNSIDNSPVYAFAVYNKLRLVTHHNDFAFATQLSKSAVPKNEFASRKINGYNELWYTAGPEKVVIIVKRDRFFLESITLFSYLFCSFLLLTACFWLFHALFRARLKFSILSDYLQMSIRSQIHGIIIFIVVVSFLVIGAGTIMFFIGRYEDTNREKLSRTINIMEKEVKNSLSAIMVFDDVVKVYDAAYKSFMEQMLTCMTWMVTCRFHHFPCPIKKALLAPK
jgi:hypothetical protein